MNLLVECIKDNWSDNPRFNPYPKPKKGEIFTVTAFKRGKWEFEPPDKSSDLGVLLLELPGFLYTWEAFRPLDSTELDTLKAALSRPFQDEKVK